MRKFWLAMVGAVILIAVMLAPALFASPESTARFEYLRLTPGSPASPISTQPTGYRACVAGTGEWTCRSFVSNDSWDDALRRAMSAVGNEGWELVSMIDETQHLSYPRGLTYIFKRRVTE